MQIEFKAPSTSFTMGRDQILRLPDALGLSIASEQGALWITQDGDLRDTMLRPGETFVSTTHARTMVQAVEPSLITLSLDPKAPKGSLAARAARALTPWRETPALLS